MWIFLSSSLQENNFIIVYYRNYNLHLRNSRMWFVKLTILNYFLCIVGGCLQNWSEQLWWTRWNLWGRCFWCHWGLCQVDEVSHEPVWKPLTIAIKGWQWRMLDGSRYSVKWYPVTQIVFGSCRSIFDFEAIKDLLANPNFSFWYAIPYWT